MRKSRIHITGLFALLSYGAFITWRLFFYAYSNYYREQMTSISYNLIPFKTIMNYMQNSDRVNFDIWIYNLAGNVAAFIPLGLFIPLAFKDFRAVKSNAAAFILILSAEVMQLISRRGAFDVDDLLLNMVGSIIGYAIFKALNILSKSRR